jgi:signal peptidase I
MALTFDEADVARWAGQLAHSAVQHVHAPRIPAAEPRRRRMPPARRLVGYAGAAVVGVITLAVGAVLVLILAFDYHPLVVRSGSMEPTLEVGDLVLVRHVPASRLQAGDIATFDVLRHGGTTHRVVSITELDGLLVVESQGDANPTSERWSITATDDVGLVRRRIPWIGIPLVWLASDAVRPYLVPGMLGLAGVVIAWPLLANSTWRRRSAAEALADGAGAVDDHVHARARLG